MKFLIATHNIKKRDELSRILKPLGIDAVIASDIGMEITDAEETGTTFAENARIKAESGCRETGLPCIADDSGLCVDALDGRPGVYSARYAGGHDTPFSYKIATLLDELKDVPDEKRTARFVCVISYIDSNGKSSVMRGECEGIIGKEMKGDNGFGYDPIFMIGDRSFAEISSEEKNKISHRANALKKLTEKLKGEKYDNNKAES